MRQRNFKRFRVYNSDHERRTPNQKTFTRVTLNHGSYVHRPINRRSFGFSDNYSRRALHRFGRNGYEVRRPRFVDRRSHYTNERSRDVGERNRTVYKNHNFVRSKFDSGSSHSL